jgi:hypothetical protein
VTYPNQSYLPEIGGDAAPEFSPESVEDISFALEVLLTDSSLRHPVWKRGLARASHSLGEACVGTVFAALKGL